MGSDGMIDERSLEEISHRHFIFLWWAWRQRAKCWLPPHPTPHSSASGMTNQNGPLIAVCARLTPMIGGRSTIKICNCSVIIYLY